MLSANERITLRQLQVLLVLGAMGTGVIVLPRRVAEFVAVQDGWLVALGLGVLGMGLGWLVAAAARVQAGRTFMESVSRVLSRPVAYAVGVLLWVKLVVAAGLEMRVFMIMVQDVLLPRTPMWVVGAVMIFVCAYAAAQGIEARARIAEVLLWVLVVPFVFLFIVAMRDIEFLHLQPMLDTPPRELLKGTLGLGFMFTGLACVWLLGPFISPEKNLPRAVVAALGVSGVLVTGIVAVTVAKFGPGAAQEPWPVLRMMDMLRLPGGFIERQEALMCSLWIATIFVLVNALLFFGGVLLRDMKRPGSRSSATPGVMVTAVGAFAVACVPWDATAVYQRLDWMWLTLGVFFLVGLPLVVLGVAWLRGMTGRKRRPVRRTAVLGLLCVAAFLFTGCWDRVEIENRAFVVAIGVDTCTEEEGHYAVTLTIPPPHREDEPDDPRHTHAASALSVSAALQKLDAKDTRSLFYGQAKMVVLGHDLLQDAALLQRALAALSHHSEIDRRIYVLAAAARAADILQASPPGEALPGLHMAQQYRYKRKQGGASMAVDLETLTNALQRTGHALLPALEEKDDELCPHGAVLLRGGRQVAALDAEDMQGFLWAISDGNVGTVVHAGSAPFVVETHTAQVRFAPGAPLRVMVEVTLTGRPAEATCEEDPGHTHRIAQAISRELAQAAALLQAADVDGYGWLDLWQKKHPAQAAQRSVGFAELEVVPQVRVIVK